MSTFRIVAPLPSNQDVTSPHDDPLMPIFSSHIRSFDTKIMMEYVISGIDANKAAKLVPSRPAANFIFVYDSNLWLNSTYSFCKDPKI